MSSSNESLFAEERKMEIVNLLNKQGKVFVPELVERFNVSFATIRNDLRELEIAGKLKRTHGGAISAEFVKVGYEMDHSNKAVKFLEEKQAIARKAVELIEDDDIIILDTGTTTMEIAKLLYDKKNLTVIVNDIEIAACLEKFEGINIVVIGGTLRRNFHCTLGPFAVNLLSELNVDKLFLATNCFSPRKGCTTPDINHAEVKKTMVGISSQVIVVCDSSKLDKNSFVQFAKPEEIDVFITDERAQPDIIKEIKELGIDVQIAPLKK